MKKGILFREVGALGADFAWSRPGLAKARLRGDYHERWRLTFAGWAAATGGFLILFARSTPAPDAALAVFFGLITGFTGVYLWMFGNVDEITGTISLTDQGIRRFQQYAGFMCQRFRTTEWPYSSIRQATIVAADDAGLACSVLLLHTHQRGIDWLPIGPQIDLDELADYLRGAGFPVERSRGLVGVYFGQPWASGTASTALLLSLALLVGGGYLYHQRTGGHRGFGPGLGAPRPPRVTVPTAPGTSRTRSWGQAKPAQPTAPSMPPVPTGPPATHAPNRGDFARPIPGQQPGAAPFKGGPPPGMGGPPPGMGGPPAAAGGDGAGRLGELAGGQSGVPFRQTDAGGRPLLGLRCVVSQWAGQSAVSPPQPIFDRQPGGGQGLVAKDGYAVGAIKVAGQGPVTGVQLVFMKLKADGTLDPKDSYGSAWVGQASDQAQRLDAHGAKVIGVHGRRAAVLDALGLVTAK